ncbi:hypothetical protein [Sulfitobacter sp. UBA4523]|uniref:hypothetical protein n=1 Tax=Sulfitobacter sp. UBA4523 TaxID=1947584 RepID=UPI000C458C52|nr:hypothetical protein [Sulfitobacter sp. UBA4523]MAX76547.1 hypothetical protein [Roseobacter sp.]HBR41760.1 hypothetical protein [Sulfitobacter pontiacus]
MERSHTELQTRWDIHTERQISVAKAGSVAVTVLNSGSWLALLSQMGSLKDVAIGPVLGLWGLGALLGTLIWFFIYVNAVNQMRHDFDQEDQALIRKLHNGVRWGIVVASGSLFSFGLGVIMLAFAL